MFHRQAHIEWKKREDGEGAEDPNEMRSFRILASTDDAVDMGGWREILKHDQDAIDSQAASALLLNHNPDQIVGRIDNIEPNGAQMWTGVTLAEGAKTQSGVEVSDVVRSGALRGASIGYTYGEEDADWDRESRTMTVRKWRLLELSLTPIPADGRAGIQRSVPFDLDSNQSASAGIKKERVMPDAKKTEPQGDAEIQSRLARAECEAKVRALAEEHGVSAKDLDFDKGEVECLKQLLSRKAKSDPAPAPKDGVPKVQVIADETDKLVEFGKERLNKGNPRILDLARRFARIEGEDLGDDPLTTASWIQGRAAGMYRRDAANKNAAGFTGLLANVFDKKLLDGFNAFQGTWERWCSVKDTTSFKQVTITGLSSGNLSLTPENIALPELTQADGSYNATVGLYGATVSLSYQMLVNDDLGQFMDQLQRAGYLSSRTIDRQAFSALLNATWTNDVTTSASLATAGLIDKTRQALLKKPSPANQPMGIQPAVCLVDPSNMYNAQLATGRIYAIDKTVRNASTLAAGIEPIESVWVGDTTLLAGALTTDYYLCAPVGAADTVTVMFLNGLRTPQIMPFDPGAVAAEKWKIILPFTTVIATHAVNGTTRISGIQKGQA